jgi:hypothetical protein
VKSEGQVQSQKHERRLAGEIGGSRNAASGAFWLRKGDVRSDDLLIEHKWTGRSQFTLKAKVLEDAMAEALISGRTGLLGLSLNNKNYVVMDEEDFLDMRRQIQNGLDEREHP